MNSLQSAMRAGAEQLRSGRCALPATELDITRRLLLRWAGIRRISQRSSCLTKPTEPPQTKT